MSNATITALTTDFEHAERDDFDLDLIDFDEISLDDEPIWMDQRNSDSDDEPIVWSGLLD